MRTLLAIVILAVLAWSGYWWFNASMRERALTRWLAEREADGWQAETASLRVTGFPNRVDTIATGLDLADPEAGWHWQASEFQILSLAYQPQAFIVALPGEQRFATPIQAITSTSSLLRGSIAFRPTPRLELDHSTFEIEGMNVTSDLGWSADIGKAILATRQTAGVPFAHDVAFNADSIVLPNVLELAGISMPETLGPLSLDTTLSFDRPWDRSTVEGDNPSLGGVEIREMTITWGELDLRGTGAVAADANGYADGTIELHARNWRGMLSVAEASGAIDPTIAGAVRAGLGLIARLGGGDGETLTVPLAFSGGRALLGPIPIGVAPRLVVR